MTRELEDSMETFVRNGGVPRDWIKAALADGRIANAKQAWATLSKWVSKGVYEYGVSLDLGWKCEPRKKKDGLGTG